METIVLDWYEITLRALESFLQGFLGFAPKLIGATIVFIIGWLVATAVGKLVAEILKRMKFNQVFERGVWKETLEKAEFKVNVAEFLGAICKWIIVIVFLLATVEILGLVEFAKFLTNVLGYIPNVIIATLIFVVTVIITDVLEKVVRAAVEGAKVGYGQLVGGIVKWSIWIFAILAILMQLQIAPALLQTLFAGIVGLITIAGGIAFGLGGKEVAAEILQDLRKKLSR